MLFASDCTKELTETNIRRLLSLETKGKRRKRSIGIFHLLYLCCHSRIFLVFFSIMHKQIFYAWTSNEPWSARQDLFTISCILISPFSLNCSCTNPELRRNGFFSRSARTFGNKIGMCFEKPRQSVSKSKRVSNPNQRLARVELTYLGTYVRVHVHTQM